jgi:hypothetical protein
MPQKGDDNMNIPILQKIIGIALALFFLSGCAVFVRDGGGYHHHGHWRHHSSIQQVNPLAIQMTARNSGKAQQHDQVSR